MLRYGSWPEEQWRYAVIEEEEKKNEVKLPKRQKWKWGVGVVIHMVNGNSKGFKVLGKNEEYGVSDV